MKVKSVNEETRKRIKEYNDNNPGKKITFDRDSLWEVEMILSKMDYLKGNNPLHSAKEFSKAQFESVKIKKLKGVNEIVFHSPKGKVSINSELLISNILQSLPEGKKTIGRPKDEALSMCLENIQKLIEQKIPIEFIAYLFEKEPETFKKQLRRTRTKGSRK
jgi:hypothetical protein